MTPYTFALWLRMMYDAAIWRHTVLVEALYPPGPERDRAMREHIAFTNWVYSPGTIVLSP